MKRQIEKEIAAQFELIGPPACRSTMSTATGISASSRHRRVDHRDRQALWHEGAARSPRAVATSPRSIRGTQRRLGPHCRAVGRLAAPACAVRGLIIADAVFGLAWSGAMTKQRLAALLRRLPPGVVEIYLHPAMRNSFAGAAPGYRYTDEFAALCDADCVAAVRQSGYAVGGYSDVAVKPAGSYGGARASVQISRRAGTSGSRPRAPPGTAAP